MKDVSVIHYWRLHDALWPYGTLKMCDVLVYAMNPPINRTANVISLQYSRFQNQPGSGNHGNTRFFCTANAVSWQIMLLPAAVMGKSMLGFFSSYHIQLKSLQFTIQHCNTIYSVNLLSSSNLLLNRSLGLNRQGKPGFKDLNTEVSFTKVFARSKGAFNWYYLTINQVYP